MASSSPNKSLIARAAVILTNSEVAAATFDLNGSFNSSLVVEIDFTVGSLTNGIFRFYGSTDGVTFVPLEPTGSDAAAVARTYTADTTSMIPVHAPGVKFFRVTVQGTDTLTSSSATVTYRWLRRGTQA